MKPRSMQQLISAIIAINLIQKPTLMMDDVYLFLMAPNLTGSWSGDELLVSDRTVLIDNTYQQYK